MDQSNDEKALQKRKGRSADDVILRSYDGLTFVPRPSTGCPGSPHRFFESSYDVQFTGGAAQTCTDCGGEKEEGSVDQSEHGMSDTNTDAQTPLHLTLEQVVHRHANGLCIVTAGEHLKKLCETSPWGDAASNPTNVVNVDFIQTVCDGQSVGGKRKKKRAKLMKSDVTNVSGRKDKGTALPTDTLASVSLRDGRSFELKCCVMGSILELNHRLDGEYADTAGIKDDGVVKEDRRPSLLQTDPLLDGYLAVILPKGRFPPQSASGQSSKEEQTSS